MTNYKFYYNYQTDTKTSNKTLRSPPPPSNYKNWDQLRHEITEEV